MLSLKISKFILPPDDREQKGLRESASRRSNWRSPQTTPAGCTCHTTSTVFAGSLIDALTSVTDVMCFPQKHPPEVWSTVRSHEQVRVVCLRVHKPYVCATLTAVWTLGGVWDGEQQYEGYDSLLAPQTSHSVPSLPADLKQGTNLFYLPDFQIFSTRFALEPFFTSTLQGWNVLCAKLTCVVKQVNVTATQWSVVVWFLAAEMTQNTISLTSCVHIEVYILDSKATSIKLRRNDVYPHKH